MPSLNSVMIMGNLTRDPEVRYTPKGTAVGELGIAINSTYRTQDGATREEVTYVDVEVWDRQAESCKQYLRRGSPVFVEGRLKLDTWEKDGQKFSRLRVRGDRVQFLRGGDSAPASASREDQHLANERAEAARQRQDARQQTPATRSRPAQPPPPSDDTDEESIPF